MSQTETPAAQSTTQFVNMTDLDFQILGDNTPVYETDSLCMRCGEMGITKMMMTKIPNFREVIIASFKCPHCGWRNAEANLAGQIQDFGRRFVLTAREPADLGRQIVKSKSATFSVDSPEFEVPPEMLAGVVTTVEGMLRDTASCLQALQPERRAQGQGAIADGIDAFCNQLAAICDWREGDENTPYPFTVTLDDPAGNSFIQNRHAPAADPDMADETYRRSAAQCEALGIDYTRELDATRIVGDDAIDRFERMVREGALAKNSDDLVQAFELECPICSHENSQRMTTVDIPHFKEVIIMSYVCDKCGYRTREVKAGGAYADMARRTVLHVEDAEDLNRDVLKGDMAVLRVPELDLELSAGVMAGTFTTVEGVLQAAKNAILKENPLVGDSADPRQSAVFSDWLDKFDVLMQGQTPFTLEIDDPVDNSYIQSYTAPDPDPQLEIEQYVRTFEQNELLGLNDADFTTGATYGKDEQ